MSNEQLKKFGKFYYAKFENLNTIDEFEHHLYSFIQSGAYYYGDDIVEARQFVDKIKNMKIEIYSNEHPPPHFHVTTGDKKASFDIDDCNLLVNTGFDSREIRNIRDWFLRSKDKLIEIWNATRPTDCVVGKIRSV